MMPQFYMGNLIDESYLVRKFQINFAVRKVTTSGYISHVAINLSQYKACYNKNVYMTFIFGFLILYFLF